MVLETPVRPSPNGHPEAPVRRVALVVRVSTDRQATNPEGSLKTQLQRLRQHVQYKRSVAGEEWIEVSLYELKAVSGKDSMRSDEYEELFAAISAGRVNTVLCTAPERLCRSVKDFLHFFEFINEHGAEFVCLKQNYDTTTAQGRLFVTIMMALAEFEREQTAERTRDATLARAEHGLLHCGRCGTLMEGRSGTRRLGVKYFYYVCCAKDCALRVAADEVEGAVFGRVQELAADGAILGQLVEETNRRLAHGRPALDKRRDSLQKQLDEVKAQAERVLAEWSGLEAEAGRAFVTDMLSDLAQRRADLERGIAEAHEALRHLAAEQVTAETVWSGLERFGEVLDALTPFERKELVRLVVYPVEVAGHQIALETYRVTAQELAMPQGHSRFEAPDWLPG